uniref:Uncharacterized protein n=1 Tax=Klebsiella pneumoniae TaxID=573 RepID=A0A6G8FBN2_KLEPN|nr:hypothetical protein [Klebsiella pneumoniae]
MAQQGEGWASCPAECRNSGDFAWCRVEIGAVAFPIRSAHLIKLKIAIFNYC